MKERINKPLWDEKRGRWVLAVQREGKRRYFYSSTHGRAGQRGCNRKADAWIQDGLEGGRQRVQAVYSDWLKELQKTTSQGNWKPLVVRWRNWFLPSIGLKRVEQLTDNDLQQVVNAAAAAGLSRKTLQNMCADARAFCKYCRRCKLSNLNPEFLTVPAGARLKGKKVLSPADIATLFRVDTTEMRGKTVYDKYIGAYRFAVLTGLRPGELIGLRWKDIDGDTVRIQRAVNVYNEQTRGKNDNAVRAFTLPPLARAVLDKQRELTGKEESIFCINSEHTLYGRWRKYCSVNGIAPISLYELRNSFVSAVKQLPAGEVKDLVGHSADMDTFGQYSHIMEGDSARTAEEVNAIFAKLIITA